MVASPRQIHCQRLPIRRQHLRTASSQLVQQSSALSRRAVCCLFGAAAAVLACHSRQENFVWHGRSSTEQRQQQDDALLQRRGVIAGTAATWAAPALSSPSHAESSVKVGGEKVTLANGMPFEVASFGLQVYSDRTAEALTKMSLEVGYRNFFSSVLAQNQVGFARGVKDSNVPRSEMFICGSVLSNNARSYDSAYKLTKKGCDENLEAFAAGGIDYVDMIMLDYPAKSCAAIQGQWKAFEEMLAAGKTRSLAVSNFSPQQLDCLLEDPSATRPVLNQMLYGVGYENEDVVEQNKQRGIVVQAWSPLGNLYGGPFAGGKVRSTCEEIGKRYGKSAAQVALKWIEQTGATFTTQTRKREHFVEDLDIFDFKLSDADMRTLSALRA